MGSGAPIGACDPRLMFERFTERARQVVILAQEEAHTLMHSCVGTEHILLGLLREQEGLAAHVLAGFDVTLERVRQHVVRIVGSGEQVSAGQIPFTPRAKEVLELALRESQSLGHNYIGTEHILLALVRESEGVAMRILIDNDVDSEQIRHEVIRLLSGPGRGAPIRPARITGPVARIIPAAELPHPVLDWQRASMLWRPEGLELRIPLHLNEGAMATFAADAIWSRAPLDELRLEIWNGWLSLASEALLDEVDPAELRRVLDGAARRAVNVSGRERGRVEDFLRRLREDD